MDAKQNDGKQEDSTVPLAVLMISFNEEHNMEAVLENLSGFASEIFLVDNFSSDQTVDLAFKRGVYVVQRGSMVLGTNGTSPSVTCPSPHRGR